MLTMKPLRLVIFASHLLCDRFVQLRCGFYWSSVAGLMALRVLKVNSVNLVRLIYARLL